MTVDLDQNSEKTAIKQDALLPEENSSAAIRHLGLDAIRGLAILLVIFHHVGLRFPDAVHDSFGRFIVSIGWGGVDIFFAISGYLIAGILLKIKSTYDLKKFFKKRLFRIVPLYFVALIAFVIASLITRYDIEVLHKIWINFIFLTSWVIPFLGENGVPYTITWSLSVEESAYILFGVISLLGIIRFRRALIVIAVAALGARVLIIYCTEIAPELVYYFVPARLDAIAIGGIASVYPAILKKYGGAHWSIPCLATFVMLGIVSAVGRHNPTAAVFGYTFIGIASAWFVASVANISIKRNSIPLKAISSIGLVSYFCYLFHVFVIAFVYWLREPLQLIYWNIYSIFLLVLVLTYMPALISWKYFELPIISYARRGANKN